MLFCFFRCCKWKKIYMKIFELVTGKDCQINRVRRVSEWVGEYDEKKRNQAENRKQNEGENN